MAIVCSGIACCLFTCIKCSQIKYNNICYNDGCCCRCHPLSVSNMSSNIVGRQPSVNELNIIDTIDNDLPKYGEEVIYHEAIFNDDNEVPPPGYLP